MPAQIPEGAVSVAKAFRIDKPEPRIAAGRPVGNTPTHPETQNSNPPADWALSRFLLRAQCLSRTSACPGTHNPIAAGVAGGVSRVDVNVPAAGKPVAEAEVQCERQAGTREGRG